MVDRHAASKRSPYRDPSAPPPDREMEIVWRIEARVVRLRWFLIFAAIVPTVLLSIGGYVLVQEAQFALNGRAILIFNALLGVGPPMAGMFKAVEVALPRILSWRTNRWIATLAAEHGLPPESVAEYFSHSA